MCMLAAQSQSADLSDREKDVYRIYSLLMTNPRTSHGPDDNPRYLIAATTRVEQRQPCVNAPPSHAGDLAEALADSPAVLIHGPRQCGKTTLARRLGEEAGYSYFSFDDEVTLGAAIADPVGFVSDLPEHVIDEAEQQ